MKPIRVRFKQLTEAPNVLLYQCLQTPDEVRGKANVISSEGWSIRRVLIHLTHRTFPEP